MSSKCALRRVWLCRRPIRSERHAGVGIPSGKALKRAAETGEFREEKGRDNAGMEMDPDVGAKAVYPYWGISTISASGFG